MATSEEGTTEISSGTYRLFLFPAEALTNESETNLAEPRRVASVDQALDIAITVDESKVPFVALVAPEAILNHGFAQELKFAITDPGLEGLRWIALASDGVDSMGDPFDTGNYLENPATPTAGPLRIADWSEPAVSVVSISALKNLAAHNTRFDSFPAILRAGMRDGLPVFLTRRLRYSSISIRWTDVPTEGNDQLVAPVPDISLDSIRPDPSLTVVIRTSFERPWLLARNLTALATEHQRSPILEAIVVSTADVSQFTEFVAQTDISIDTLPLTAVQATQDPVPSRTAAMFEALTVARGDYVWYVDDDDWIAEGSLQSIKEAVHAVDRPILIGASEVFEEQWDTAILTSSTPVRRYLPREWYRAFTGWNFLPNCSLVLPRHLALQRIADCPVTRDFGEDYALQLLLLTAPGSMVQVIEQTIAHISRRTDDDNVVTMSDRVPWLRDLGSHISDISRDPSASTAAYWRLGSEIRKIPYPEPEGDVENAAPTIDVPAPSPSSTTYGLAGRLRKANLRIRRLGRQDPT